MVCWMQKNGMLRKERNMDARQDKTAVFDSREEKSVVCPHCWTEQRTDREFCYHCGARFVYLDEAQRAI